MNYKNKIPAKSMFGKKIVGYAQGFGYPRHLYMVYIKSEPLDDYEQIYAFKSEDNAQKLVDILTEELSYWNKNK